jgi:hypothetical protein
MLQQTGIREQSQDSLEDRGKPKKILCQNCPSQDIPGNVVLEPAFWQTKKYGRFPNVSDNKVRELSTVFAVAAVDRNLSMV